MHLQRAFFLLLLACTVDAVAQTRTAHDTLRYAVHASSTSQFSGGNLDRVVTQNRLTGELGDDRLRFLTENAYRFGKNGTRVVENDLLTRNYLRVLPDQRLYYFAIGTYETNFRRSIDQRWQAGGGAAFSFFRKGLDFLRMSGAVVQEEARYAIDSFNLEAFNGSARVTEPRAILRFGGLHTLGKSRLALRHDTWYMIGLKDAENHRWHTLLSAQVPVHAGLSVKVEYEYTYESLVIQGRTPFGSATRPEDWLLAFGLSYDLAHGSP
jgi:Protein of unknown function, DUF481